MQSTPSNRRRMLGYLKPHWHLELAALIVMAVLAALTLALPMAVEYMIDTLIPGLTSATTDAVDLMPVVYFGLFLLGVYLANVIFALIRDYLVARVGATIIQNIRCDLFRHLQRTSLSFYGGHQIGEVMSRVLSDVSRVQYLMTTTLLTFVASILMVLAVLCYLLYVNWVLTLIAIIPVPLTIFLSRVYGVKLHGITRRLQETLAGISAKLQETLLGLRTVKAFGQERREEAEVDRRMTTLSGLYVKTSVTTSLSVNLVHFVNMIGPVVVLAWGTYLVAGGAVKLGALIAFYILLTYLYQPIRDLAEAGVEMKAAMASVDRIFEYMDLPPDAEDDPNPVTIETVEGNIGLENVTVAYPSSDFRLGPVDLSIEAGEKVALVGPSGSGKTTIANLLLRFVEPSEGMVTLDGVDVRRLRLADLRLQFGLVDQDPLLFRGTVRENVAYANPEASEDDITRAIAAANIAELVSRLPDGVGSQIGERGVTLSGGEKQRICLARAILRDPPILILDEATSALDAQAEQAIQKALDSLLVGKTAVIIAHRLSTVRHCDRIVVLDRGRIVDQGTHDNLMASSELYRSLATGQLV